MTLKEFRQQYPQYDDMSDMDLAKGLHEKLYSDMPFDEFSTRIGLAPEQAPIPKTGDFAAFEARFKRGEIKPINSDMTTLADMGQQTRKGVVQGFAGMAALPEMAGTWLAGKATQGLDALMGREHQPVPRFDTGIPSPGDVGQMAVEATGVGEARTTPGRYMNRFGQFMAGVPVGGPANLMDKVIRAGTSAAGTEAASTATKGKTLLGVDVQPYAEVIGGLLGGFAPDVARRIVSPFPINAERQRLLGVLDDEGVDLTAGQRTGREGLKYAEAELGGGRANQVAERQGEQFTGAALRRAGIDATRATPEVIDDAFTRLGNQFDDLASRTNVPLDRQLQDDLLDAVVDYQSMAAEVRPVAEQIVNRISELANQNNGTLAGAAYQDVRSRISKILRSQGADPALKEVAGSIGEALDDAVERTLSGQLLDTWRTTRTQYRNLKTIEQAATAAGEKTAEGLLSPSQLRTATVQKQGRTNYARGRGDFADLARAGEATMKPLPQSGSAPRLMVRTAGATAPTILGTILGGASGVPGGQVIGGLLGSAVPFIEGRVLMSRPVQAWLANQAAGRSALSTAQRAAIPLLGVGAGAAAGR
jgi:hypothetical protein